MPLYLMVGIPYAVINLWILLWFWRALSGAGALRLLVCLAVLFLAVCFPLCYKRPGDSEFMVALIRIGAFWLGMFLYIFFLTLLADGAGFLARALGRVPSLAPRYGLCLFIIGFTLCLSIAGWFNAAQPVVREYSLTLKTNNPSLTAGGGKTMTLAAVSDLHLGRTLTVARLVRVVDLMAPHKPDAVFFLGDVLDDYFLLDKPAMHAAIACLRPPLGVWGILGNHEYIAGSMEESVTILEDMGIHILRDAWTNLGGFLLVAGRDDYSRTRFADGERKSLPEILAGAPEKAGSLPLLVLDHQPRRLEDAEEAGAVLQLSGHTHNGQLWPMNMVIEWLYENPRGLSTRGDTQYVVSVGAGTWGPPMRNNARPEVLILHIRFEDSETAVE